MAAHVADFRAGISVDADLDDADRAAGRRIDCPVLALLGDRYNDASNHGLLATRRDGPHRTSPSRDGRSRAGTASPRSCPASSSTSRSPSSVSGGLASIDRLI
jgi:hypothetical protein